VLVSAVTDPHAGTCTWGHNLYLNYAVRYGKDKVRHCRMCELLLMRDYYEREIRMIEDQGRRSWKS
jgi:hypothetical protein